MLCNYVKLSKFSFTSFEGHFMTRLRAILATSMSSVCSASLYNSYVRIESYRDDDEVEKEAYLPCSKIRYLVKRSKWLLRVKWVAWFPIQNRYGGLSLCNKCSLLRYLSKSVNKNRLNRRIKLKVKMNRYHSRKKGGDY